MSDAPKTLFIIPARFGSKGIPRKCIRPLNGKPLFLHVVDTIASAFNAQDILISTDDEQVSSLAKQAHADIKFVARQSSLADDKTTLDDVIYDVVHKHPDIAANYEYVVTIQPTSPLITQDTLKRMCQQLWDQGAGTVLSATEKRKLTWRKGQSTYEPNYTARVNRQELDPYFEETGAFIGCKTTDLLRTRTRIHEPTSLAISNEIESLDIDTFLDWSVAESLLQQQRFAFLVIGSNDNGTGHVNRALTIANAIPDAATHFFVQKDEDIARKIISGNNYKIDFYEDEEELYGLLGEFNPTAIVHDCLDSSVDHMSALKAISGRVITFEDLGAGAKIADVVINELYPPSIIGANAFSGPQYACLRPEFMGETTKQETRQGILITFGGTDPNNLTAKTLKQIARVPSIREALITVVLGPGYDAAEDIAALSQSLNFTNLSVIRSAPNMAEIMRRHLVAISSAGRTIYELAASGTAVCTICQNGRELTHLYANAGNGILNFGLHSEVNWTDLFDTLYQLLNDANYRDQLSKLTATFKPEKGLQNVLDLIRAR